MNKTWIGLFLLLILTTQIFPVEGLRFWSNLLQSEEHVTTASLIVIDRNDPILIPPPNQLV